MQKNIEKKADGGEKKTKRLLAGYEKIIRTRVEEINDLRKELTKLRQEREALETLKSKEQTSMTTRISEL